MSRARSGATAERPALVSMEPIAVDRVEAARALGIAVSTFEGHVSRGTLPKPRQLGGRAIWLVDELRATARALPVSEMLPPGGV